MTRGIRITLVALALHPAIFEVRAYAQSRDGTFAHNRTSLTSVRQYVAAEAVPTQLTLPPNLLVSPGYRRIVEAMLRASPTFRRQCLRIAGEPHLSVRLRQAAPPWQSNARATTHITRQRGGGLSAVIDVFPLDNDVELIAHEIEHVIEQLDEVDLASRAALPDTGVRALRPGAHVFETTRAKGIGLKVSGEVRAAADRR